MRTTDQSPARARAIVSGPAGRVHSLSLSTSRSHARRLCATGSNFSVTAAQHKPVRRSSSFSWRSGPARQQVLPERLDLHRIARPLQPRLDGEARAFQGADDDFRLEEVKVDVYLMAPPLAGVLDLRADVERDEEQAVWPQHPVHLAEGGAQLGGLEVDDRVERDSRAELGVGRREGQ